MLSLPLVTLGAAAGECARGRPKRAVIVEWDAEPAATGYNVYRGDDLLQPVNPAPLKEPSFEDASAALRPGAVLSGAQRRAASIRRARRGASAPQCVTPRDQFPPAAPQGLAVVPTAGQISLIWDANTEKDLAGYLVLRGEGPDGAADGDYPDADQGNVVS